MKKGLKILLVIFVFLLLLLIASPILRYFIWQKSFESNTNQIRCTSNTVEDNSLDDKFKNFVLSKDKTSFVELFPIDVAYLLKDMNKTEDVQINNVCVIPDNGKWHLFVSVLVQGVKMPWISADIVKDDMETAQIYVSNIYIGGWRVPEKVSKSIKSKINKGISDAITLANENNFLGRRIENVELLKEKVVVKGSINN